MESIGYLPSQKPSDGVVRQVVAVLRNVFTAQCDQELRLTHCRKDSNGSISTITPYEIDKGYSGGIKGYSTREIFMPRASLSSQKPLSSLER